MPSVWIFCLLAAILFTPGCAGKATMGEVSGTVQVDGVPAKTGSIAFIPVDGNAPTAGATIEAGRYSAKVPLGNAKVEIRVSKVIGQKKLYDTPNSPVQLIREEILPEQYNDQTELLFVVQPGKNQKDFNLTTAE